MRVAMARSTASSEGGCIALLMNGLMRPSFRSWNQWQSECNEYMKNMYNSCCYKCMKGNARISKFIHKCQEFTNSYDAQAPLGYSNRCLHVMAAHRLLSSAMCSNEDIDWLVHSLMLSLHDLRSLPLWRRSSTVPRTMIIGCVSRWHTWNYDNLRRLKPQTWSNAFLSLSQWNYERAFWYSK